MDTGIKKGFSVGGRVSSSVIQCRECYIRSLQLHLMYYHFWTKSLPFNIVVYKLLTLLVQRKIYFILKEEKEPSSLFGL